MFKKQDPYSYTQYVSLYKSGLAVGVLALEYRVALYNDVQVLNAGSVQEPANQQFYLYCTQRIMVNNEAAASIGPQAATPDNEAFTNYPALIETYMKVQVPDSGVTLNLMDYSPQTINTAVQESVSGGSSTGTSTATSNSTTTGSSFSQSSSYGASATVGDSFSGATVSYDYSTTSTTDKSKTAATDSSNSSGTDSSSSASMSIKDWGSYGWVNPDYIYPTWVFGQEYPWNAIECRYAKTETSETYPGKAEMYISNSMASALYDGTFLYPPSELSQFGLNFVMKAVWRIYVDYTASTETTIVHNIQYYSASHTLTESDGNYSPSVYLDSSPATLTAADGSSVSLTLDLNIMALDPLGVNADAAIVGFIPSKFIPPAETDNANAVLLPLDFKIIATTNDLMIQNNTIYPDGSTSGFSVSQTSMTATWDDAHQYAYQVIMYFKITDSVNEYTFRMKHWKKQDTGVKLTIVVNNDVTNPITKYVDSFEGEGGDNNILTISLRDLDFASIDYHDYLQLGLNSIAVTMEPIDDAWSNCVYQIRAVSIAKDG